MPRKKKTEPIEEFRIKFTGKMTIVVEMEQHGPMEFRINDLDAVNKIVSLILDAADHTMSVNSYNTREQKAMQKLLDGIQ